MDELLQSDCINKTMSSDIYRIKRILNYEDLGRRELVYIYNIMFQVSMNIHV